MIRVGNLDEVILVTGVPGSGKSTLSSALGKELGCKVVNVTELVKRKEFYTEIEKDECGNDLYVVNMDSLAEYVLNLDGCVIVEGVVVDFVPPEGVKKVIYLQANVKDLISRMEKRGYCKEKICSNLEAELIGSYLLMLKGIYGKRVICVNTSRPFHDVLLNIKRAIECERLECSPHSEEEWRLFASYCLE